MIFDGVLLASDYDGTLTSSEGRVTEGVRRAIRHFIENGGKFTVCTGRCHKGFHSYSPEIINAPVLLANGGMAYDYRSGEIVVDNGIGDEGIKPLRAVQRAFPGVCIELYPFERCYSVNLTEMTERHFTSQNIPFQDVKDPAMAPRPWAKVMIGGTNGEIAQVQQFLRERFPDVAFLPTTGRFLEILKVGVDKGSALLALADRLGISHENVYAVGDGYNDVEMLRAAAKGFVPANGEPEALACADCVVRSNDEDAVAHVIEILEADYAARR